MEHYPGPAMPVTPDTGIVAKRLTCNGFRAARGTVFRLNLETGKVLWQRRLLRYSPSVPCVAKGHVFLATDKRVEAFEIRSGRSQFRVDHPLGSTSLYCWPTTEEILGVDVHGNLVAFSSASLEQLRTFELGLRNPVVFTRRDAHILIGRRDAGIRIFDPVKWTMERTHNVPAYSECLIEGNRAWLQTQHVSAPGQDDQTCRTGVRERSR
jgi:hypothetical protein